MIDWGHHLARLRRLIKPAAPREMDRHSWDHLRYHPSKWRTTHAQRLERWLGADTVENIREKMATYYGPPIAIANVPGLVYATKGGDFVGPLQGGYFGNFKDYYAGYLRRVWRNTMRQGIDPLRFNTGFSSLSDLINEATAGGKKQVLQFAKTGITAPAAAHSLDMWRLGTIPAAGANASTANAGTVYDSTVTGALRYTNPTGGDTMHFVNGFMCSSQAQGSSLLLCDKLYAVNRDYNTTANQAITGVPTRYQTSATAPGNIQFTNVTTAFGATPSNVTLTYVDQDGNTAEAGPAQVVRISSAVDTNPLTPPLWIYLLNTADTGLRALTNFVLSAAMGAGAADRGIYHPIAILPGIGAANTPSFVDGINSSFNLERIYDSACLDFIEFNKSSTTAANYVGSITICAG
jgi:hypothetical protein